MSHTALATTIKDFHGYASLIQDSSLPFLKHAIAQFRAAAKNDTFITMAHLLLVGLVVLIQCGGKKKPDAAAGAGGAASGAAAPAAAAGGEKKEGEGEKKEE
ncbi:hypothetical protein TELCIR_17851 [Teladorsagia circumcincta]|uniref:Uncharacterized protein n=1 Tax=Teladorsagia circumcincta TaxID=45464 RepID=A0A2G9TRX8_TELCI|nr:hypothetical protein TELCIR_17851 [Teladorsagia circumcincta]